MMCKECLEQARINGMGAEREASLRGEVERLRDTLGRIAREFTAIHKDTDACDSIGEIYHLLRECKALQEEEG